MGGMQKHIYHDQSTERKKSTHIAIDLEKDIDRERAANERGREQNR